MHLACNDTLILLTKRKRPEWTETCGLYDGDEGGSTVCNLPSTLTLRLAGSARM